MSKMIIKESQLRRIIEESVKSYLTENDMVDEGFFSNMAQGFKGAFSNDANRVKAGVNRAKEGMQNAYNNAKQGVQNAYNSVKQGTQNAYDNVATGVNQRVDAFKQNYQAGKYADKVDSVMRDIDELLQNGVISGNGGKQAAMQLKKCLNMAKLGKNGRAAQARNRVGK